MPTYADVYPVLGAGRERHSAARQSSLPARPHSIRYSQFTCFTSTKVQSATESSLSLYQALSLLALNPIPVYPITSTRPDGARAAPPPHTQAYAGVCAAIGARCVCGGLRIRRAAIGRAAHTQAYALQSGLDAYAAGSAYAGVCATIGRAARAPHTPAYVGCARRMRAAHTQAYALRSGEQHELRIRLRMRAAHTQSHTQAYALQSGAAIGRAARAPHTHTHAPHTQACAPHAHPAPVAAAQPLLQQQPSNRTVMPVVKLSSKLSSKLRSKLEGHRHRHASFGAPRSSHS
jgi:hypothetical protein